MNIRLNMPGAFAQFREEGEIVGRLIVGYGQLEWDLCLMVGALLDDWDTSMKAMFRSRGEAQRLKIADALARQKIPPGQLLSVYQATIADLDCCRKLRNQYAHTQWAVIAGNVLSFIDVEKAVGTNQVLNLGTAPNHLVTLSILRDQERFFAEVSHNLVALNWAMQALRGEGIPNPPPFIVPIKRPEFALPA